MPTGAWRLTYSEAGMRVVREVGIVLKMFRGGREFGEIHGKSYRTPSRWTMGPLSGSLTYTCLENMVFEMESEEESEEYYSRQRR